MIRLTFFAEHPGVQTATERDSEMSAAELDVYEETEGERIERWRAWELERAGYDPERHWLTSLRTTVGASTVVVGRAGPWSGCVLRA